MILQRQIIVAGETLDNESTMRTEQTIQTTKGSGSIEPSPKTLQTIKNALQEAANRHGLKIKKPDQSAKDIHDQLAKILEKILTKIKNYFENEIKIKWSDFEPYPEGSLQEQKDQHDWKIFFMSLRNQSMRYILIDKPDFFGDAKLAAYMKEKLL